LDCAALPPLFDDGSAAAAAPRPAPLAPALVVVGGAEPRVGKASGCTYG
jgi:hypothetical protein